MSLSDVSGAGLTFQHGAMRGKSEQDREHRAPTAGGPGAGPRVSDHRGGPSTAQTLIQLYFILHLYSMCTSLIRMHRWATPHDPRLQGGKPPDGTSTCSLHVHVLLSAPHIQHTFNNTLNYSANPEHDVYGGALRTDWMLELQF